MHNIVILQITKDFSMRSCCRITLAIGRQYLKDFLQLIEAHLKYLKMSLTVLLSNELKMPSASVSIVSTKQANKAPNSEHLYIVTMTVGQSILTNIFLGKPTVAFMVVA